MGERRFFDGWMAGRKVAVAGGDRRVAAAARGRSATVQGPHEIVLACSSQPERRRMTVAIIDYGSGNLHSAAKAPVRQRARRASPGHDQPIVVTRDPDAVARADRVVLPGVGAFADCRRGLDAVDGMVAALETAVRQNARPFFGICVGMQLMAERGREYQVTAGPPAGSPARSTASRRRATRRSRSRIWAGTRSPSCATIRCSGRHRDRQPPACTPISFTRIELKVADRADPRRPGRVRRPGHRDRRPRHHGGHAISSREKPAHGPRPDRELSEKWTP